MNHGNIICALDDLKIEIEQAISKFEQKMYECLDEYDEEYQTLEEHWDDTRNDFYELLEREEQ